MRVKIEIECNSTTCLFSLLPQMEGKLREFIFNNSLLLPVLDTAVLSGELPSGSIVGGAAYYTIEILNGGGHRIIV